MASDGATIRHATREDVPTIFALIKELAVYENALDSVETTEESLSKTLSFTTPSAPADFSPGFAKTLLVTAPEGEVCAMALYFYSYSTWTGPGVYLEDLFVKPAYRKRGYGKALIKALAREVLRVGGARLEWSCLDWNQPSLDFYEGLGAKKKVGWYQLRTEGEALKKLAES
ncbi:GCN5-related N-acetyltransferas-like protein [Corynespora cassiicola Philippines]|uniref:GCN5-related N-acetyltransferas-like protein n=1 Tax=Corynespora cassiicola Philippines TaxID=1448308 RepID=A0A2T2NZK8_CORCC|nr:GCN5-related N-acetyltransferas-like protein [Corynespora cassiicola Philippines]